MTDLFIIMRYAQLDWDDVVVMTLVERAWLAKKIVDHLARH